MTPTQEKFLREFAEKLGWETGWWCEKCHALVDGQQVTYQEAHEVCGYPVISKDESGLVTPDGQAYLVQRAREEGYKVRTVHIDVPIGPLSDDPQKTGCIVIFAEEGHPCGIADSEPWATALAVAKALYGLEMEAHTYG